MPLGVWGVWRCGGGGGGDGCVLSAGQHLAPTEWKPSDTYLMVAAHLLLEACEAERRPGLLWKVVLELEEGHKSSPSNHQITLLLFRVYAELGKGWGTLGVQGILHSSAGVVSVSAH